MLMLKIILIQEKKRQLKNYILKHFVCHKSKICEAFF